MQKHPLTAKNYVKIRGNKRNIKKLFMKRKKHKEISKGRRTSVWVHSSPLVTGVNRIVKMQRTEM